MAFLGKSSKYLINNRPVKFFRLLGSSKYSILNRTSTASFSTPYFTARHYSICDTEKPSGCRHNVRNFMPILSFATPRCLSTDSQVNLSEQTFGSSAFGSGTTSVHNVAEQSADKVLFVDTLPETAMVHNPMVDSASEIIDSAALTLSSDTLPLAEVAEPTLASLGIAGWSPVGLVQQGLEILHINVGMPWWLCIITATCIARTALFPIFVLTQRNTINLSNHMPQLQFLQAKFGEARRTGNAFEAAKIGTEIMAFMKEHKLNPMKNALLPLAQAPVFISFFLGLRGMAKLPVESMKEGGFSWIMDLTIPDPYYIMPVVASSTLYVILKIGAESGMRMENMRWIKYIFGAMPVIILPFTINFPSTVLFYWCTSNFLTLLLVTVFKINAVRQLFKIPQRRPPDPKFVQPKKGFVQGVKDAYNDQRILGALEERARMDDISFKKAGTGPIPRTYAYDPTKPRPVSAAATAAKLRAKSKDS